MKINLQFFTIKSKSKKNIFILYLFFSLCFWLFADIAISKEDESARLEKGEILLSKTSMIGFDKVNRRRDKAIILINAPISRVIETILDHNHYPEFMPSVTKCKIVKETKTTRVTAYRIKMGVMKVFCHLRWIFDLEEINFKKKHPEKIHLDCFLDNNFPANVADIQGTWDLEPLSDNTQTKVTYTVYMKSGRLIPKFIESYISRKQLPEIMKNVRNRVMSGGIWKKGDKNLIISEKAFPKCQEIT